MRPLCSVIMASYQRAHLLKRSLACYERQEFDNDRFEIIVVDDHSTDGTRELVLDWSKSTKIRATVLTVSPKPAEWVDCGWVLNAGIRASSGDHLLLTHPELMPGRRSVQQCVVELQSFERFRKGGYPFSGYKEWGMTNGGPLPFGMYACCKPYYLSPRDQDGIDTVNWKEDGPLAVRKIMGFYDLDQQVGANPDYTPQSIEAVGSIGYRHSHWLSWVFGGCSRETWKRMGGMIESSKWGSVDVAFMARRKTLGILNHTLIADDTLCAHQNHDLPGVNVPTPRIEEAWKQELAGFPLHDAKAMQYPAIDNLGWN